MDQILSYHAKKQEGTCGSEYYCLRADLVEFLLTEKKSVIKTALWLALQNDNSFKKQLYANHPTIFDIKRKQCARATNIAPTSVTNAINRLEEAGFFTVSPDNSKKGWWERSDSLEFEDDVDMEDID